MSGGLDPRRAAMRPDLADARLEGRVSAARFVEGERGRCRAPLADLRAAPDLGRPVTAQLLLGEPVRVFEHKDGWAWAQSERDGYVGYVASACLTGPAPEPTHRVRVLRALRFATPELKIGWSGWAPMGGLLALTGAREGRYAEDAEGGWWVADHLEPLEEAPPPDWVAIAERFEGAPYFWGGETVAGVDCSGLIQVALEQVGRACPRDSDMQAAELGRLLEPPETLRRGDLVFWTGHVGVMLDGETLLHANAGAMLCARERLSDAVARIEAQGEGRPTARRRLSVSEA